MNSKSRIFGVLLIALGSMLLLDRLEVISLGGGRIFWMFLGIWGGLLAVQGFSMKRRGRIFWGSLLFFLGIFFSLDAWDLIWLTDELRFGGISLALGLAFVMLYAFEPRNFGVLVPAVLFVGFGAAMILVEYDYLDWWEVRRVIRTYWPLVLILWGAAMLVKRRPQPSQPSD
jgi:hypothetical protein